MVESSIADYFYPRNTKLFSILYFIATLYLTYLFYQKKGSVWFCLGFVVVMYLIFYIYMADQKEYGERYRPGDNEYPTHITTCPDYMVFDNKSGACKPISGSGLGESAVEFGRRFSVEDAKKQQQEQGETWCQYVDRLDGVRNEFGRDSNTLPSWHTLDVAKNTRKMICK